MTGLKFKQTSLIILTLLMLSGCVSTVVGAVVDTAIEVAKVPFKVGGAVIDVVSGDDDKDEEDQEHNEE